MRQPMGIAKLRHRVVLCSQKDVVINGEYLELNREEVMRNWASIEAKKGSQFSPHGATMNDNQSQRTHVIKMRYRDDLQISAMAWIYEERLKSAPRWYKILGVIEDVDEMWKFDVRLVERADDIEAPKPEGGIAKGLPAGVRL